MTGIEILAVVAVALFGAAVLGWIIWDMTRTDRKVRQHTQDVLAARYPRYYAKAGK